MPRITWSRVHHRVGHWAKIFGAKISCGKSPENVSYPATDIFQKFNRAGHNQWTITHGFFADMGGFVLTADDLPRPIPLNAEQLFYLVDKKHVECPTITARELKDRNKSDGLARFAQPAATQRLLMLILLGSLPYGKGLGSSLASLRDSSKDFM